MRTKISAKVIDLLKRDFSYADFALSRLISEMRPYEKKYSMTWKEFVDKFESGKLGDDRIWFTWYGLALNAKDWDDTKKEIKKTIGAS